MKTNGSFTMFYGANATVFEKARELRNNMTATESILWESLKGKKILGLRFRRQHPINQYIADFYCHPIKVVVEVDGGIHELKEQKDYDFGREKHLNDYGIRVIRFSNDDIENNLEGVLNEITRVSQKRIEEIKVP